MVQKFRILAKNWAEKSRDDSFYYLLYNSPVSISYGMLRKQLLAVSSSAIILSPYRTVFKLKKDFKGKGGNFCSKTIKYCFYPKLKAIADIAI